MQDNAHLPSEVISGYLEAIYYMQAEEIAVRSARLAEWLGVSRPTVTVALGRMRRDGLIEISPIKEIKLTSQGRTLAETIVRRHRIIERWLTDALGLDWVTADEEAAHLEYAVSEVVEQALWRHLKQPTTCPHGNPIPGISEQDPKEVRLSSLAIGTMARVSRISEVAEREAPQLLSYLGERRLVPRAKVKVLEVDSLGKTLRINVGRKEVTLAEDTANKVSVVPQ